MFKLKKLFLISFMLFTLFSCGGGKDADKESKTLSIYTWTYFIPKEVLDGLKRKQE